jgi:uncharacterized membrane protein YkgB
MKKKTFELFDLGSIAWMRKYGDEFGRFALFVVFVWFGILKVFELSPAAPLVAQLFDATFLVNWGSSSTFLIWFGLFEVIIGIMILIPKLERITFLVMGLHLITTVLPMFLLPEIAWFKPLVPTLIGQYIIKNIALLALGMMILAKIKPMTETHSIWAQEEEDK